MRLKDLRWHIIASIILLTSYAALAICFYLTVRSAAISSLNDLTVNTLTQEAKVLESTIDSYYDRFLLGDFDGLETDFNKAGYADKMGDKPWILEQPTKMITGNMDTELCVFFYHPTAEEGLPKEGYIPLKKVLEYTDQKLLFFNDSAGIKFNQITEAPVSDMAELLQDDAFLEKFNSASFEGVYTRVYTIQKEEGILAIQGFHGLYLTIFVPVSEAIFSVHWVLVQAITFFVVGIVVLSIIVVIIVLGCRKAAVLLRVDRRSVENTNSLVIRVKKDGTIIFANIAFMRLLNLKKIPDLNDFKEVNSDEPIFKLFKQKKTIQCYYDTENGKKYLQLTPIGVVSTYYLVGSDITEEFLRIQDLERLNGKNELTGCDNNFALNNMFPVIISHAETDLAFVEFTINKYAEIISLFGHDNFVILLKELLSILKVQFEGKHIYQVRDERFIIIVPNDNVKEVVKLVNQTQEILKKPILVRQNNIYVVLKACICNLSKDEMEGLLLSEIMRRIDLAFNSIATFSTKDVVIYDPGMEGVISARMQLEDDLKEAIETNSFLQYLQPQFDVVSNRVVGFESLIRWDHPKYINKSPQEFIELAEQKGYILDISRFVVDNTFVLAKKLEPYNVSISMNLSPIQIIQVGFVNDLKNKFKEYNIKPGSIALEITETFLMENFSLVNEKLKLLKNEGFKIHLDDFGTGYSSMAYLKDLPVDTIKIDYQFTKYVDTNKVNYSIVSCISTLAKELGLDVIVEGVETNSQKDVVKKLGCRIIQGYLIGKPMPYEEALKLLSKDNVRK